MEAEIQAGGTIVVQDVAKRRNASEMELLHWLFDNYELAATIVRRKPGAKPFVPAAASELVECNRKNAEYIAKLEACTAKCIVANEKHVQALERENAELKQQLAKALTVAPEQDGPPPAVPERDDEPELAIPTPPPLPPASRSVKLAEAKSKGAQKQLKQTAQESNPSGDLATTLAQTMAKRRGAIAGNDNPDDENEWDE